MSFGGWREVTTSVAGDTAEYGCNDIKLVSQLFNGLNVPAVKIASTNGFYFTDSALRFRNPLDTLTLTIRTPAIPSSLDLSIPAITVADTLLVVNLAQTVKNKTLDATCDVTNAVGAGGTPGAHATTHKSGGSDPIKLDEFAAPTDILTLNASTSAHGLLPKLSNVATQFLNGLGNWAVPAGGGGGSGSPDVTGVAYVASDGTGDYMTLTSALTAEGANKKYVLAPGDHAVSAQLVSSLSNIWIQGSGVGVTRILFTGAATTGAAFLFQGSIGSAKALTANSTRGSHTITVGSTSGIVAGDWIYVRRTVTVQTSGNGGQDAEIHQVYSVSSTVITLVDQVWEDYLTSNGGTVYRIAIVKNLHISDLTMYDNRNPASVTNITEQSDALFLFQYNLNLTNVMFEHMLYAACTLQNCVNSSVNSCYYETPKKIATSQSYWVNYGLVLLSACLNVTVNGGWANNCRHSVTTDIVGGTYGAGKQRGCTINGMVSYHADTSHFDTHEGAPGIIFNGCYAMGGYHQSTADYVYTGTVSQQTDNVKGFTTRSPAVFQGCVADNCQGYAFAVFNDDTNDSESDTIPGGNMTQIKNCRIVGSQPDTNGTMRGIRVYGRKGVVIEGNEFFNVREECIYFSLDGGNANTNRHTIIKNNVFHSCGQDLSSSQGLIFCEAFMDELLITGNLFASGTAAPAARPLVFTAGVDGLLFEGNDVQGLTNKMPIIQASSTRTTIINNPGLNPINKIASPLNNTNHTVGCYGGSSSTIASATDYTVVGGPITISVTGGTVTDITIKDGAGQNISTGGTTPLRSQYLANGFIINITHSVAPTIVVSAH